MLLEQISEFEQMEQEFQLDVSNRYDLLTIDGYDEDRELNSIDGFGSESEYREHYIEEAIDWMLDVSINNLY